MTNFANDLRIEGRIANDLQMASQQLIQRHPAAMIAAAHEARSQEMARLLGKGGRAIAGFIAMTWSALKDARQYRQTVRQLEGLSDYLLLDIGLERGMIPTFARAQMAARKQKEDTGAAKASATPDAVVKLAANGNEWQNRHQAA